MAQCPADARSCPSPASIAAAREKVGYRLMRLDAGRQHRRTAQAGHEDRSGRHRQRLRGGRGDGRNPRFRHHADDGRGGRKHRPRRSAAGTIGLAHRHRSAGRRPTAAAISLALAARPPPRPATSGSTPRSPASATRTISTRKPASRYGSDERDGRRPRRPEHRRSVVRGLDPRPGKGHEAHRSRRRRRPV